MCCLSSSVYQEPPSSGTLATASSGRPEGQCGTWPEKKRKADAQIAFSSSSYSPIPSPEAIIFEVQEEEAAEYLPSSGEESQHLPDEGEQELAPPEGSSTAQTAASRDGSYQVLDLASPDDEDAVEWQEVQIKTGGSRATTMRKLALEQANYAHETLGMSQSALDEIRGIDFSSHSGKEVALTAARISYCTCCFGRDWQLLPALCMNVWSQLPYLKTGSVRFVISLVKDPEEAATQRSRHAATIKLLREWFSEEIRQGWLVIGVSEGDYFHSCRHKNRAHKLALEYDWGGGGRRLLPEDAGVYGKPYPQNHRTHWLVNLDADNVLSRDFAKEVLGVLQAKWGERPKGITGFRCKTGGGSDRGVTGRVGLTAESFLMLGGYNEEFHPTGCQDIDLFERCKVHQAIMFEGSSGWSIPNTLSKRQGAKTQFKVSKCNTTLKWHEQNDKNWEMSKENIKSGCWWANYGDAHFPFNRDDAMRTFRGIGQVMNKGGEPQLLRGQVQPTVAKRGTKGNTGRYISSCAIQVMAIGFPDLVDRLAKQCGAEDLEKRDMWMPQFLATLKKVHTLSFEHVGKKKKSNKTQPNRELTSHHKEQLSTIMVNVNFIEKKDLVIIVDLRQGYGRQLTKDEEFHLGTHPQLLEEMSEMESFAQHVRHIKERIRNLSRRGHGAEVAVICIDCSGGHACVAFAELLHLAVQLKPPNARGEYLCSPTASLKMLPASSRPSGFKFCGGIHGPCDACRSRDVPRLSNTEFFQKSKALRKAVELWHEVEI